MPYNKDTGDAVLKTTNEQIALLRAALEDLAMCMQGVIDEEYKPDSFTLQAARKALAETSEYSKFILCYAEPAAVVGWKSNIPNTMLEIHLEGVWELGDTFHRPIKEME